MPARRRDARRRTASRGLKRSTGRKTALAAMPGTELAYSAYTIVGSFGQRGDRLHKAYKEDYKKFQ
jgi:hypothetical protein